ncbi:MAG: hypothetical protein IPN65_03000 [Elusimicrobia bacterium]|nr:hypothetical protein [Elusimicrobiota bacterium]MBK7545028.1 hypothetical protein [Elusimicrobiota bacterium]MBK7688085.1 hypothetical protein [Elusimicrobiota bacterium]MBK8126694.1 hypothetical protein [Elusimicrobiota bacterium]MBK9057580.1 hypothetical protein [Elusimicrobiota bacterium]
MNSFPFQRFIAGGVALVFLATNSLLAYSPETSLWAERRKTARRQEPPQLASLPLGP